MAGKLTISTLNNDTGVLATQNGMTGICKAWVNFNGTGTVAIRGSFNVSSITDNGAGDYTVNFTTAMPNTNYSCLVSAQETVGDDGSWARGASIDVLNTGSVSVFTFDSRNPASPTDVDGVHVAVLSS
jgi:hypothetical protein